MAKVRAYKIAEELGISREDLVEKAAGLGVELKSAMASLELADADMLREKLGGAKLKGPTEEKRVQAKSGSAVIRRRRVKVVPPPDPPPPEPEALSEAKPIASEVEPAAAAEPEPEAPSLPEPAPAVAAGRRAAPAPTEPKLSEAAAAAEKKGRKRKRVREVVNLREQEQIARQATGRGGARRAFTVVPQTVASPRRRRRDAVSPRPSPSQPARTEKRLVRIEGTVSVGDLAKMIGAKANEVQGRLMALGTMASINQLIDVETVGKLAEALGFEIQDVGFKEKQFFDAPVAEADSLELRPPVITIMGHVDHGKTSLLDAIRKTDVVSSEAGGITQHIGAYQVTVGGQKLTFIDTPGHEAFTTMRARGAQVTDIVVLVVAASEGIMPQTVEAIDHSKAAGAPILVAVNKTDLPDANPQQVRQRLMEHGLVPESFGGDIICVDVSAKTGVGIDTLLEMLSLQAELLELRADPKQRASGVVLEAQLDKGRGPVATVLVQNGTLKRGDFAVAGTCYGRVRAMQDDQRCSVAEAGPSLPVQVIGLSGVPDAGQLIHVVESERVAKQIVDHRHEEARKQPVEMRPKLTLDEIFAQAEGGGVKELPIVLKADVHGSLEAVRDAMLKLSTDEVKVNVIHAAVGGITENDVMLAKASGAIVVGFHVRPDPAARRAAEGQGVEIRNYQVIYDLVDEVKKAMVGLLPPRVSEIFGGRAEVRKTFTVPRVGTIAGCYITEGVIKRNARCRLLRDGVEVHEGKLGSLKRFKDDVRDVATGFECGMGIEGYNDVKVGDVIETHDLEEKPAEL